MNTRTETQLEFDFMESPQTALEFDTNINLVDSGNNKLITLTPSTKVIFHNGGRNIGVLDWSDGIMKFTGDADTSGQLFFDNVIKQHIQMGLQFKTIDSGWKS